MILIIDDDIAVRTSLQLLLGNHGYDTAEATDPEAALQFLAKQRPSLIILDMNFSLETSGEEGLALVSAIKKLYPDVPIVLITAWATIQLAVKGIRLGASDFINKPWNNEYLLQTIDTFLKLRKPGSEKQSRTKLNDLYDFHHIVGEDKGIIDILSKIGRIAATDASVLITGESGTGKELIAEAIHQNSLRADKAFIKVNLGGISASLFESEMFGHVRGAFTDAKTDRVGRFELANRGTIFLDEIGELDPGSQVKLLRVLQDRTFEVLGSSRARNVNVRVICATNRDLEEMVKAGRFREDLLYRINLITLKIPSLRERKRDIPLLVNHFLSNLGEIYNRPGLSVSPEAIKWLQDLPLPGNIRQLKNLVERTILICKKDRLEADDFEFPQNIGRTAKETGEWPDPGSLTLEAMEIQMIRKAMELHKNRITKAAKSLGITRGALYRRLEKYNIPYDETSD